MDAMTTAHRLMLLRHAKSSWNDAGLADHDRPLSGRGRRAVVDLREHLSAAGTIPELVLCSTAVRTVQTLEGVRAALSSSTVVELEPDLYGATAGELLDRVHRIPPSVDVAMLIGHNPGIEDLAMRLVGRGDENARTEMEAKYPTAALAELSFEGPWSDLAPGGAALERFWSPHHDE
jgi:phosphohistidine phosphatase